MAAYKELDNFKLRITNVNDHFESHKNSSLHGLLALLESDTLKTLDVIKELLKLPEGKVTKYRDAIDHLLATYPMLTPHMLPGKALKEARAARFPKVMIDLQNGDAKKFVKGTPPTAFLDMTCEGFLANNAGSNNGVVLIHLCAYSPGLDNVYNGKKVIDHIKSVLSVAASTNTPVCSLSMTDGREICTELQDVYKAHPNTTSVFYRGGHMGTPHDDFFNFVNTKDNCIVLGFDGTVCVHANIFGGHGHETRLGQPAPPIITLANVITSRAVLSTVGDLRPKQNWDNNEYGVLFGT
jgi:hypothetical protein